MNFGEKIKILEERFIMLINGKNFMYFFVPE